MPVCVRVAHTVEEREGRERREAVLIVENPKGLSNLVQCARAYLKLQTADTTLYPRVSYIQCMECGEGFAK